MNHLLAPGSRHVLAKVMQGAALLAFDFDGTLAPITKRPSEAEMTLEVERVFRTLCKKCPCAVITGRRRADVLKRLKGVPVKYVVGNHGIEPSAGAEKFAKVMRRAFRSLHAALANERGVEIENKLYSLSVHYRRAKNKRQVRSKILTALAPQHAHVHTVPGKLVVNVLPIGAPDKGEALARLCRLEGARTLLYVGDDVTDESVFRRHFRAFFCSVRVRKSALSSARFYLKRQAEVRLLLTKLARLPNVGRQGR
ncbi:MAG: trehalose-phosphatase [Myxococcaceae bacterium]